MKRIKIKKDRERVFCSLFLPAWQHALEMDGSFEKRERKGLFKNERAKRWRISAFWKKKNNNKNELSGYEFLNPLMKC